MAHRGSSATHKGNSLPAFVEAVRVGADVIELDVVLCKTGEVGGWVLRRETRAEILLCLVGLMS